MSAKAFFKSTSFKCIAVLLSILLVCGVLLTICNALFYVTPDEIKERAIKDIYGRDVNASIQDISSCTTEYTYSTIEEVYFVDFKEDGKDVYNYLVKVTGKEGYGNGAFNGTVGCWVALNLEDDKETITNVYSIKVISDEAKGETFLNNINSSHFQQIYDIEYTDGFVYELGYINGGKDNGKDFISTGASYTMRAISNAINGAVNIVKELTTGEVTEEPEEEPTAYDDYIYADFIDKKKTTHELGEDGSVIYHLVVKAIGYTNDFSFDVTVANDKTIAEFTMTVDGSTEGFGANISDAAKNLVGKSLDDIKALYQDDTFDPNKEVGEIFTGASLSDTAHYRAAAFALANYNKAVLSCFEYSSFVDTSSTVIEVNDDNSVKYNIKVNAIQYTNAFEFEVVVSADKKIASFVMKVDGSTEGFGANISDAAKNLVGKSLDDIKALYQDDTFDPNKEVGEIFTGASLSDTAHYRAAAYALANYDLAILLGGNA